MRRRTMTLRVSAPVALVVAVGLLAGCGDPPTADRPVVRPGELSTAGGIPCPRRLPTDAAATGGLGTEQAAEEVPSLLAVEEAWVCRYDPVEVGPPTDTPTRYAWRRAGHAEPVARTHLARLEAALDDLAPADGSRTCTADLGSRWLVVYSHGGDLTGVAVDDYGCRDVRLTDRPR